MREKGRNGLSAVYKGPENAARALDSMLFGMRVGETEPKKVIKEVEAAAKEYGEAVDYCIDNDDTRAAIRICRVMGITEECPVGRVVVEFLHEKAEIASRGGLPHETAISARMGLYSKAYEAIIRVSVRLYSWLYDTHPEVLYGSGAQTSPTMPEELNTPEARELLDAVTKAGLCECVDGVYTWKSTLSLLAYFADKASGPDVLGLSKKENAHGDYAANWKPFGMLFRIGRGQLSSAKNGYRRTGGSPRNHKIVDNIFKQCGYDLPLKRE